MTLLYGTTSTRALTERERERDSVTIMKKKFLRNDHNFRFSALLMFFYKNSQIYVLLINFEYCCQQYLATQLI